LGGSQQLSPCCKVGVILQSFFRLMLINTWEPKEPRSLGCMWFGSPGVFHDIVLSCGLPCFSGCEQKTCCISLTLMLVVYFARIMKRATTTCFLPAAGPPYCGWKSNPGLD
jgi:hypothetical protein